MADQVVDEFGNRVVDEGSNLVIALSSMVLARSVAVEAARFTCVITGEAARHKLVATEVNIWRVVTTEI